MFNLFKKKKIRVIKSRRLIDLQKVEGLKDTYTIVINVILDDFHSRVQTILNELHIYDDKVYIEAYKEYRKNYIVYDRVPELLLYKIPVFFATAYSGIESQIDKEFACKFLIPDPSYYEALPKEFKLKEVIEDNLKLMYSRIYPYLPNGKASVEGYMEVIRFNYCKNWDLLWSNPESIRDYFDECMKIIESFTDKDCWVMVRNTIERCAEELGEKLLTLKTNKDEQQI